MADTYYIQYDDLNPRGWSYGYTHETGETGAWGRSMLTLFNHVGSGKVVRLKQANAMHQFGASSSSSNRNAAQVEIISAHSGGVDISDQIYPLDTGAGGLPAQIEFVQDPTSITNQDDLHAVHTVPQYTAFRDSAQMTCHTAGHRLTNFDMGTVLRCGYSNSGDLTQPIILNEGEGIAMDQYGQKLSATCHVWITFTDGTDTYVAETYFTPWYSNNWFALFNDTGSGVVLQVLSIETHEEGDTSEPVFEAVLVDTVTTGEAGFANVLTPVKHDTNSPTVDSSQVAVYENALTRQVGGAWGAEPGASANWTTKRKMFAMPGKYRLGDNHNWGGIYFASEFFSAPTGDGEIILREGEGVALRKSRAGMGGRKEISFVYTVEDATETTGRNYPVIGGQHIIRSNYGR
jgi:hypothetical protein